MQGDPYVTAVLSDLIGRKTVGEGRIVNDTLNPSTHVRRQKTKREGGALLALPPSSAGGAGMMLSQYYFPSANRELFYVEEDHNLGAKRGSAREEQELFPRGPDGAAGIVEGSEDEEVKPKAIEYVQQQDRSKEREGDDEEKNDGKFFITEDEMLR